MEWEGGRQRGRFPGGSPTPVRDAYAGGLNCRVRNGTGCFPSPMATGKSIEAQRVPAFRVLPFWLPAAARPEESMERSNTRAPWPSGYNFSFPLKTDSEREHQDQVLGLLVRVG